MKQQVNTRNIILDILLEINEKNQFTHIVLSDALKKYQYLSREDRAFISHAVKGTVERLITIDYIINKFSKINTQKMKPVIRNILRMAVYQIVYMDGNADFAACDEAVKLAAKKGFATLKGFVNGVLRSIARNKSSIEFPDDDGNGIEYMSVYYSTPEWIVAKWINEFGREQAAEMLAAQFVKRPLTIRCNTSRITVDKLTKRLRQRGITVNDNMILPEALSIADYDYLEKIPEFNEGLFFVQDISSMLVCHAAKPDSNSYVIDLCAAPGGKSMHIAEILNGTGYVEARDVSESKVLKIRENIERLELENVAAIVKDARITDELSIGKADIVIADLPCSGLGILGKKPDIKYHTTPMDCQELVKLQREILKASADYVKQGGVLVYSTCTVNAEENIDNVRWFLDNFPFKADSIAKMLPKELHCDTAQEGYVQLLPGSVGTNESEEGYDGFFIARFIRK